VRERDRDASRRRQHPQLEALEGRALLAALSEFPLSTNQAAVAALTAGPDGNLWFPGETDAGAGQIVRITPSGGLTDFPLPANCFGPSALTIGPDNNFWFTDLFNTTHQTTVPAVAQITPAGVITEFATTSRYSSASALTVGPDNNLWFTESSPNSSGFPPASVGRITTAGVISEFPLNSNDNVVSTLTVGPDKNLWFSTAASTNAGAAATIGRITPAGMVSEFGLPATYSTASALTAGPDGNLWFTDVANDTSVPLGQPGGGSIAIGRITPAGTISEYPIASNPGGASTLTVGPDGSLWFSEAVRYVLAGSIGYVPGTPATIGRITPAGIITEFPLAPDLSPIALSGLTMGPDRDLYFTFVSIGSNLPVSLLGTGIPGAISIGRITTSGTVVEFTGTVPALGLYPAYAPTVGSDGNLWFSDGPNIGRLDRALATPDRAIPPGFVQDALTTSTKKGFTGITFYFDEAMNPASVSTASLYSVAGSVKKHHKIIYSKMLKIRSVTYNPAAETAMVMLARPFNGYGIRVTVHGAIMAANGTSIPGNFTVGG
jgi:virginiamycin B lyase